MATSCGRCCFTSALGAMAGRKLRISHADLLLYRFSLYCPDSSYWSRALPIFFASLYLFQSLLAALRKSPFVLGIRLLALRHHADPGRPRLALVVSAGGSGGAWRCRAPCRVGADRLGPGFLLRIRHHRADRSAAA